MKALALATLAASVAACSSPEEPRAAGDEVPAEAGPLVTRRVGDAVIRTALDAGDAAPPEGASKEELWELGIVAIGWRPVTPAELEPRSREEIWRWLAQDWALRDVNDTGYTGY